MKLVIFIPTLNDERTIQKTVLGIPRNIVGIDEIKILVVDSASCDKTREMAMNGGADKIVSHEKNDGLGAAFWTGIKNAISMDADILVTLDTKCIFESHQIGQLIRPILNHQADVVVGSRFHGKNYKKLGKLSFFENKIFSIIISKILKQKLTDVSSKFRAFSRKSLYNVTNVHDTLHGEEILIDLKFKGLHITEVPLATNFGEKNEVKTSSGFNDFFKKIALILKSSLYHRPMLSFSVIGAIFAALGIIFQLPPNILGKLTIPLSVSFLFLGGLSFLMGVLVSVVLDRRQWEERDLRQFFDEFLFSEKENIKN